MESSACQACPGLELTTWSKGCGGEASHEQVAGPGYLLSLEYDVAILFASADQVRKCMKCRADFTRTFAMPELWWSGYCRNSNGFFGCEDSNDGGGSLSGIRTWCRFLIKQMLSGTNYQWYKLNAFTTWEAATRRTVVLVFDLRPSAVEDMRRRLLRDIGEKGIGDPFWVYASFVEEVVGRQDHAVWAIRDLVRDTEKGRTSSERPRPDYFRLHDMARHAIHVSETLELSTITVSGILSHQRRISGTGPEGGTAITNRLTFLHDMLRGLHVRSASNRLRLQNEIQLAFNAVAQHDARVSVEIGRAAQADGAAMRTVAFVTLTFLPATFVCAIFSTSFFDFDGEKGVWTVSSEFWRFWAAAVPVTVATTLVWGVLGRVLRPARIGDGDGDGGGGEGEAAGLRVGLRRLLREKGRSESSLLA